MGLKYLGGKKKSRTGRIPKSFNCGLKEGVSPKRNKAQRKGSRKKKA